MNKRYGRLESNYLTLEYIKYKLDEDAKREERGKRTVYAVQF